MRYFPFLILLTLILSCFSCTSEKTEQKLSEKKLVPEATTEPAKEDRKSIIFFGNSLTAGYGLGPDEKGFVNMIQDRLDSLGYAYQAINSGLSGETTAGGNSRIDWILERQKIDIFVLELGGNDGLRGIAPEASFANLKEIIEKVNAKYPKAKIILAGMEAPPNMGDEFTQAFRKMYPKLSKEFETALIPFLLDGVGGVTELNQEDGIHPTEEGHRILADNVWKTLQPLLES